MATIDDTGKVWIKGKVCPEPAVRVETRIFVPGMEEGEECRYLVEGEYLLVDLQDKVKHRRIARRFPFYLPADTPATLFSGFEKTPHGDVQVITFRDAGVEEFVIGGRDYQKEGIEHLDSQGFWERAGFKIPWER